MKVSETEIKPNPPKKVFVLGFVQVGTPDDLKKAELLVELWKSKEWQIGDENPKVQNFGFAEGK